MNVPHVYNMNPNTGRVVLEDDSVVNVVDEYGNVATIDMANTSVHKGIAFEYSSTGTIAAGQSVYMMGRTGTKVTHLSSYFVRGSGSPLTIQFFENPTVTANGTLQEPIPRNRIASVPPLMHVYAGPTISNDGSLLSTHVVFGANKDASSDDLKSEWLLAPNTNYIFKLTNGASQSVQFSAGFLWLET